MEAVLEEDDRRVGSGRAEDARGSGRAKDARGSGRAEDARGWTDAAATPLRRIVAIGLDPYVLGQLRAVLADAQLQVEEPGVAGGALDGADLVVVDLERTGPPTRSDAKVIGLLAPGTRRPAIASAVDVLVWRPLLPGELAEVIGDLLGPPTPPAASHTWRERVERWPAALSAGHGHVINRARLAAVAVAAVLEVADAPVRTPDAAVLALAFVYAFVRLPGGNGRVHAWIDAVVAGALLGLTGGVESSYVLLGMIAAAQAGLVLGIVPGASAGALLSLGMVASPLASLAIIPSLSGAALFPLLAVTGGLAVSVRTGRERDGTDALREANRLLRQAHRVARTSPSGLDLHTVAAAALDEVREVAGCPAALLFLEEAGEVVLAASFGWAEVPYRPFGWTVVDRLAPDGPRTVRPRDADPPLDRFLADHHEWSALPLRPGGRSLGMLIAAHPLHASDVGWRTVLEHAAEDTAVAVDNARILERIRALAVDSERWRLARDLHDGIAQDLTHVRFELELFASSTDLGAEELRGEAARLGRIVGRVTGEVRRTVDGLRTYTGSVGLVPALREHVRDFSGLGRPAIHLDARTEPVLPPLVETQVFRIAQEALSNALRHSGAATVSIVVDAVDDEVRLIVTDDGHGCDETLEAPGRGFGLRTMRERAERLGGVLTLECQTGGGTRVELRLPPAPSMPAEPLVLDDA